MKLTREQLAALKKLRVREFDQDLRSFTAKQLRAEFSTQRTRRVLAKVLTRNVVFQAASWVIDGRAPKRSGNLRNYTTAKRGHKDIRARRPEGLLLANDSKNTWDLRWH